MVDYKILQNVCTLSTYRDQVKELNIIDYGYKAPYYDIRKWIISPVEGRTMLKGISLNKKEAKDLRDALNTLNLDDTPEEQ